MKGKWVSVSTHEPWWLFEQLSCIVTLLAVSVPRRRGHRYGLEAVEQSCGTKLRLPGKHLVLCYDRSHVSRGFSSYWPNSWCQHCRSFNRSQAFQTAWLQSLAAIMHQGSPYATGRTCSRPVFGMHKHCVLGRADMHAPEVVLVRPTTCMTSLKRKPSALLLHAAVPECCQCIHLEDASEASRDDRAMLLAVLVR
jgi:hypothetical protein